MNNHLYQDYTVVVLNEQTWKWGSADNGFNYAQPYFGEGGREFPVSKYGIKVLAKDDVISSCIIVGSSGATSLNKASSLVDGDQLVVCCGDTVFCLGLPDLDLKWKTQADQATCFQIFQHEDDYIIWGECLITRLGHDGHIKWQFGGADIFVSINNEEGFRIENEGIVFRDFAGTQYEIDFDGRRM